MRRNGLFDISSTPTANLGIDPGQPEVTGDGSALTSKVQASLYSSWHLDLDQPSLG